MHHFSKFILAASFALLLTGTGSFSGFSDFKARLLGVDEDQVVTDTQTEVEIDEGSVTATNPEPVQTDDASSTVTIIHESNGESVDETVTVTETTGGQTVTVTHPGSPSVEEPHQPTTPSAAFTRFKARFNF